VAPRRLQDILALEVAKEGGAAKDRSWPAYDLGRARVGSAGAGSSRTAGPGHSHVVEDAAAHDACLVLGHGRLQLLWFEHSKSDQGHRWKAPHLSTASQAKSGRGALSARESHLHKEETMARQRHILPDVLAGRFSPRGPLGILVIAGLGPRGLDGQAGIMCLRFLPCIVCHSRDLTGR
jgi:hypothetical protein